MRTSDITTSEPNIEANYEEVMFIDAEDNCEVAGSLITHLSPDVYSDQPNVTLLKPTRKDKLLSKGYTCDSSSDESCFSLNGVSFVTVSDFETADPYLSSSEPYSDHPPAVHATDQDNESTSTSVGTFSLKEFQTYMEELNGSLGATIHNKISRFIRDEE